MTASGLQVVKTASPHFLVIILVGCMLQYCEVSCTVEPG